MMYNNSINKKNITNMENMAFGKNQKQIEIIEALAGQEEAISRLYRAYGQNFPEDRGFWEALSGEETGHAQWIRDLSAKIGGGGVYFNENRFRIEAIRSSLEYIERENAAAAVGGQDGIEALSVAYMLEDALLEKKFFEIFEGDSIELKHILADLAQSTTEHRERIRRKLDAEKSA